MRLVTAPQGARATAGQASWRGGARAADPDMPERIQRAHSGEKTRHGWSAERRASLQAEGFARRLATECGDDGVCAATHGSVQRGFGHANHGDRQNLARTRKGGIERNRQDRRIVVSVGGGQGVKHRMRGDVIFRLLHVPTAGDRQ